MGISTTYGFSELFIDKQVIKIFILRISKGGSKKKNLLLYSFINEAAAQPHNSVYTL